MYFQFKILANINKSSLGYIKMLWRMKMCCFSLTQSTVNTFRSESTVIWNAFHHPISYKHVLFYIFHWFTHPLSPWNTSYNGSKMGCECCFMSNLWVCCFKVSWTRSFSIKTYLESVLLQICSLNRLHLAILCFTLWSNSNLKRLLRQFKDQSKWRWVRVWIGIDWSWREARLIKYTKTRSSSL